MFTKTEISKILTRLEQEFWEKCWNLTLLSVSYSDTLKPHIVYQPERKGVNILLTTDAEKDSYLSCYQLSHQLIHYISLCWEGHKDKITFLEEGIATHASIIWCETMFWGSNSEMSKILLYTYIRNDNYWTAYRAIDPILKKYPYCIRNIRNAKKLAWFSTLFSDITAEELLEETKWDFRDEIRILINYFYS